ncbi:MAG: type II secretion system protein [Phycisphaerales bacterium]
MTSLCRRAFTLVEILIVVVILGILAAIVVPQFSNATAEASANATFDQLSKVRRALAVFYVRNGNSFPNIVAGNGIVAWGELISAPGYLREAPVNLWVGQPNAEVVITGPTPDPGYQTTHGWIFVDSGPTRGDLWAGSFDAQDSPYPRP